MDAIFGTKKQQTAYRLVEAFRARRSGGVWRLLRREDLANNLGIRAYDPSRIDQHSTNLCGIAAFVRSWAADDPEGYVRFAIDLYDKGAAILGRGDVRRTIVASAELRGDRVPRGMQHADWLVMAALRENFNDIFTYRSTEHWSMSGLAEQIAATNFASDVVLGLNTVGYRRVIERTNFVYGQGIDNALEASRYFSQGWRVILLIHSNMLLEHSERSARAPIVRSNHWVGLMSTISTTADRRYVYPFRIFSWGREFMVPQQPETAPGRPVSRPAMVEGNYFVDVPVDNTPENAGLRMRDFADHYHGFVAAKY